MTSLHISNFFCLAVAVFFCSNTSSTCLEPFRRAIEDLTLKFANRPELVHKNKKYIDMLSWELPKPTAPKPVRAAKCTLNPGVLEPLGNKKCYLSRIWVDDALIAAVGVFGMKMALEAVIEAIFAVMGEPFLDGHYFGFYFISKVFRKVFVIQISLDCSALPRNQTNQTNWVA